MGVLGSLANIVLEPLGWTGLNIWLVSTFAISATHEHFRRITVSQHWLHTAPYSAPPPPPLACSTLPAPIVLTVRALRRLRVLDHTGHGRAGDLPLLVRMPARPAAGRRGATGWPDPSFCRSCGVRFRREERAKLLLRRHDLQGDNFNKKATLTMARVQLLISEDRLSR